MAFDPGAVGRAFSEHRFDEALPYLAKDVVTGKENTTITSYAVEIDPESAGTQPPLRVTG
jgi:hypothetical protein